jgi:hypothetical protein
MSRVYCRISEDREGAGLGVARQEADCRQRFELLARCSGLTTVVRRIALFPGDGQ